MVLADLSSKLTSALKRVKNQILIRDEDVELLLKEICAALMQADVSIKLVVKMRDAIKAKLNFQDENEKVDKRKEIQKVVIQELINLVNPETEPFRPVKGQTNVIMFVGLQGSGKTTTCTKYATYFTRKKFRCALVCADTFRAGAYDQLKQNATKARIPFYGSYTETDPVKIARDGVEYFKKEKYEIIIVDTSGKHKQEEALFQEMQQIEAAVKPNEVIFVMDGSIGQAAFNQAEAFKSKVKVGSVIITKLDGHAKGGGALSAVAATKSPITFIGTGEHFHEFEEFVPQSFISRLLGMGDIRGLMQRAAEVVDVQKSKEMLTSLSQGKFSMRNFYEQIQNVTKLGPMSDIMSMMGMNESMMDGMGTEEDRQALFKKFMTIVDSMTDEELDHPDFMALSNVDSRLKRIARGSGRSMSEIQQMLEFYKMFSKFAKNFKGLGLGNMKSPKDAQKLLQNLGNMKIPGMPAPGKGGFNMQQLLGQMGNALPGLQNMMGALGGGMGGAGRGGQMPDMNALKKMASQFGMPF